jgi:hypothetical protein
MEDVRLAERVKGSGARLFVEQAPKLMRTRMYKNFSEMWVCSTKNWFSGVNYSLLFALFCVVSMYMAAVVPPLIAAVSAIAIAAGASTDLFSLFIPAALSWLLQVLVIAVVSIRSEVSVVYALAAPSGVALMYAMLFDSSIRITTRSSFNSILRYIPGQSSRVELFVPFSLASSPFGPSTRYASMRTCGGSARLPLLRLSK